MLLNTLEALPGTPKQTTEKQEYVYQTIKDLIIRNELPVGSVLVERSLCSMLHVSRTPLRSALQRLASENLVATYPKRGTVVASIALQDIIDIFQIREFLDALAIRLFLMQADESVIREMKETFMAMKIAHAKGDYATVVRNDRKFHECYFYHTGNSRLQEILLSLNEHMIRFMNITATDKEQCAISCRDHKKIMEAIEKRDSAAAQRSVKQHMINSKKYHVQRLTKI